MVLTSFNPNGELVTDEVVRCNHSNGGYYYGYLNNTANANMYNSSSLGFFTAVSLGGTQKTVLLAGDPPDNTQVSVDLLSGIVKATESMGLYCSYWAHDPFNTGDVDISVPFVLTGGNSITIAQFKFPSFRRFYRAIVTIGNNGNPTADATLTLSNGTESESITLDDINTSYIVTFSDILKVTPSETLTLSTSDGKDANDFQITLLSV